MKEYYEVIMFTDNEQNVLKHGTNWIDSEQHKHIITDVSVDKNDENHYKVKYKITKDEIKKYGTKRHIPEDDKQ